MGINMSKENIYSNTARFYDKGNEIKKYDIDLNFYEKYVNKHTKVLEIGCGTGRVTIPLASKCESIVGLDLSESMLGILQEKLKATDLNYKNNIRLIKGDMTDFNLNQKFDLIIFPGLAILSLISEEQRIACLECVKKHMSDDCIVVIDQFNPNPDKLNVSSERLDFEYFDEELGYKIKKYSIQKDHDAKEQVISMKYIYKIFHNEDLIGKIEDDFKLGYLFKDQARKLFTSVGLEIKNVYGAYDFSVIDDENSKMLIYELKKC